MYGRHLTNNARFDGKNKTAVQGIFIISTSKGIVMYTGDRVGSYKIFAGFLDPAAAFDIPHSLSNRSARCHGTVCGQRERLRRGHNV